MMNEEITEIQNQEDFAIYMLNKYLREKGAGCVGIRRLHYSIVSLRESERQIPSRGSSTRAYENTLNEYKNLSRLLTDARVANRVDFETIIDEKNDKILSMPPREELSYSLNHNIDDIENGYIPYLHSDYMLDFNEFLNKINVEYYLSGPEFQHQTHRIAVVIEKATSRYELERLCNKYGADLLIFSGQFSVTRVNDLIERAAAESKPIALLYISDLDCAGWFMPSAFFRRINEIYPHEEHELIRVALTRDQAVHYHLPDAFDPDEKGYSKAQKERFYRETGGRSCIELDALDEDILLQLLEDELKHWGKIDEDKDEHDNADTIINDIIDEYTEDLDLGEYKERYEQVQNKYNELVDKINDFFADIESEASDIETERDDLIYDITTIVKNDIKNLNNSIEEELD